MPFWKKMCRVPTGSPLYCKIHICVTKGPESQTLNIQDEQIIEVGFNEQAKTVCMQMIKQF